LWCLKIDPVWTTPPLLPDILDYQVPVPIIDIHSISNEDWDPMILRILPYIDGKNYVKKIHILADVELDKLKEALQHLLYYKCITMVDIFQYSNMYRVTEGIHKLASDKQLQESCVKAVALSPRKSLPQFTKIFTLYCRLQPGITMYQLCQQLNPYQNDNIDVHKFILFGVVNTIIKRVHKYPLSISPDRESDEIPQTVLERMIDGKHTYDEISVDLGKPYSYLNNLFSHSIDK